MEINSDDESKYGISYKYNINFYGNSYSLAYGYNYGHGLGSGYGYGYNAGRAYGGGSGYGIGHSDGYGYGYGRNGRYAEDVSTGFEYGSGYGYNDGDQELIINSYGIDLTQFPAQYIDPIIALKETNVRFRAELIQAIGIIKIITKLGAKTIEKQKNYELLNFNADDEKKFRPYLKMYNPSIDVWHIEGVHPSCTTIEKALIWRNQSKEKPQIIT